MPLSRCAAPGNRPAGFTLVELMVTITLLSILLALAGPAFGNFIRNGRMRAVADSLQNGLRLAQTESLRRSRQVVFSLTNSASPQGGVNAVANGGNWSINTLPSMTAGETSQFVQSGVLGDAGSGISIAGPASICFSSIGRLTANSTAALSSVTGNPAAPCSTAVMPVYDVTLSGPGISGDRRLRVTVALGGQVRMCDPDKTLSANTPDGC